jgi:hypothetical protein
MHAHKSYVTEWIWQDSFKIFYTVQPSSMAIGDCNATNYAVTQFRGAASNGRKLTHTEAFAQHMHCMYTHVDTLMSHPQLEHTTPPVP